MATRGYVFCIANDATPNFVTIGATRRDTACRLREANSAKWSVPFFRIVAQVESTDAFATKRAIHALLAHRRPCNRRNIFTLTEDEARALFDVVDMVSTQATRPEEPSGLTELIEGFDAFEAMVIGGIGGTDSA
jgi:hypothetical protein